MDADRRGHPRESGNEDRRARGHRVATDQEVVLAGAVTGTVATVLVPTLYLGAGVLLQLGRSGPGSPAGMWADSFMLLALVGSIAMTAIYVAGVPLALQVERRLAPRGAVRWLVYGIAGAAVSAAVGVFFAGPTAGVWMFVLFGLIGSLGGAGGVAWARRRSLRVVRGVGPGATGGLIVFTLVVWLATGAVLVPLLVASVAGTVTLALCLLLGRASPSPGAHDGVR